MLYSSLCKKQLWSCKNENNTAYEHCELSVNGEGILALAETVNPCDIEVVHKMKWETMTFNAFDLESKEAVDTAFRVLSKGGVVIEPIHELPWNKYCATLIDRFGVCIPVCRSEHRAFPEWRPQNIGFSFRRIKAAMKNGCCTEWSPVESTGLVGIGLERVSSFV